MKFDGGRRGRSEACDGSIPCGTLNRGDKTGVTGDALGSSELFVSGLIPRRHDPAKAPFFGVFFGASDFPGNGRSLMESLHNSADDGPLVRTLFL